MHHVVHPRSAATVRLPTLLDRLGGRRPIDLDAEPPDTVERVPVLPADRTGLVVTGLTVRFGGLTAVDSLSFTAPTGRITGLIGPNGAGKTTTFDACSGLNRRFDGRYTLHGRDITAASPAVPGRLGLGRTFQRMSLCDTLTVAHNVVPGHECAQAGGSLLTQLAASPSAWRQAQAAAAHAMALCGTGHLADAQAGSLSTGQRRLVELARCLAGSFDVLLLDEASSGLDPAEPGGPERLPRGRRPGAGRTGRRGHRLGCGVSTAPSVAAVEQVDGPAAPALEVRRVSSGYGRTRVSWDVTLSAPAGSAVALLGVEGAGKTTLLRAVAGFLPCAGGSVHLGGRDVSRLRPHTRVRQGLCSVPEGRGVFRGLTVRENLVPQSDKGQEDDGVERATSAFPVLGQRLDQAAGTLSGGQHQMLAMAAAYVRRSELVLVDEASLGLAPIIVEEIVTLRQQLVREGSALLLVDQFVPRALALADTAYVLGRGRIVHGGPTAEIDADDVFQYYTGRRVS